MDSILDSGRATTANRLRAYLSRFFNWCIERDVIGNSPMAGVRADSMSSTAAVFSRAFKDHRFLHCEINFFGMLGLPIYHCRIPNVSENELQRFEFSA